MTLRVEPPEEAADVSADPSQPVEILLRHLRAGREGLSTLEMHRRLVRYGPNTLTRRQRRAWPRELVEQVAHPLALLLEVAGALAFVAGMAVLGWAIFAVVLLNESNGFAISSPNAEMSPSFNKNSMARTSTTALTVWRDCPKKT